VARSRSANSPRETQFAPAIDGKGGDILWRHDSGQVYIWEMNGLGITAEGSVAHAPVPGDWHIFSQQNFV
jgi:hypothetical protein